MEISCFYEVQSLGDLRLFFCLLVVFTLIFRSFSLGRMVTSTMPVFKGVFSRMTVVTSRSMSSLMMGMVLVHGFEKLMNRGTATMSLAACLLSFLFKIQERLKRFQFRPKLLFVPLKGHRETFFVFFVGKLKIL